MNGNEEDLKWKFNSNMRPQVFLQSRNDPCNLNQIIGKLDKIEENHGELSEQRSGYSIKKIPVENDGYEIDIISTYGLSLNEFLQNCFSKKYNFKNSRLHNPNRYSSELGSRRWFITHREDHLMEKFHELKQQLNSVKSRLNEYDLNEWHKHTKSTNPADLVMKKLRTEIKVEFLTQAWCKFYEIISEYNLVPKEAKKIGKFYSIHLCEAPGAFVASLNHYLKLNYPDIKWQWVANSLNPYYEGNNLAQMINDDRFMLQTIDDWDFGPDMTGDITHPNYPNYLRNLCGNCKPHLVTADGSFDCQDKPEEQEISVSWLNFKEILTALRILREGGHFVIKMFTFFEIDTICLMYFLAKAFESISVMKPATSKEGNSEVYVICRFFKGDDVVGPYMSEFLKISMEDYKKFSMFSYGEIAREFKEYMYECAKYFSYIQESVIIRNIKLFEYRSNVDIVRRPCAYTQQKLWEEYVLRYKIREISIDDNLISELTKFDIRKLIMEKREHDAGSHADKMKRLVMNIKGKVEYIKNELNDCAHYVSFKTSFMPKITITLNDFNIKIGKPIKEVVSSQFCHGAFIRIRTELRKIITADNLVNSIAVNLDAHNTNMFPLDFRKMFTITSDYNEAQFQSFQIIYEKLRNLQKGDAVVIIGYPLLTQFNIDLIVLLKQIFSEIHYESPLMMNFKNFKTEEYKQWLPKLNFLRSKYDRDNAVISFLPIKKITTSNNFYKWIINVNNTRVMKELETIINEL